MSEQQSDKYDTLSITPPGTTEVIRIDPQGRLFWHGREVETDQDFRAAMLDLAKYLFPQRAPLPECGTNNAAPTPRT